MSIGSSQPVGALEPGDSIEAQHERIEHLRFEVAKADAHIAALEEKTVKGYRGGRGGGAYTVSYAEARVTSLQKTVDHQVADGDKKHNRVSPGMKSLVLLPLLTDFLIVWLFLAVDLQRIPQCYVGHTGGDGNCLRHGYHRHSRTGRDAALDR